MGPDDSYLLQYSKNTRIFWADEHSLSLGARFKAANANSAQPLSARILPQVSFLFDYFCITMSFGMRRMVFLYRLMSIAGLLRSAYWTKATRPARHGTKVGFIADSQTSLHMPHDYFT